MKYMSKPTSQGTREPETKKAENNRDREPRNNFIINL